MSTASLGIQTEVILDLTYRGHCSSVDMISVCGQEGSRAGGPLSINSDMSALSLAALLTKGGKKVDPDVV